MKKQLLLFIGSIIASGISLAQQVDWVKGMGGIAYSMGNAIVLDANGNSFTTGQIKGMVDFDPGPGTYTLSSNFSNYSDVFVTKMDGSGNFLWAKSFGGSGTYNDVGTSIKLDASGNIYVSGTFSGSNVDFDPGIGTYTLSSNPGYKNGFIVKLTPNGDFIWAKTINGQPCEINSIEVDAAGSVYATGYFSGTAMDFDSGAGTYTLSAPYNDAFLAKYDASGNILWADKFGGASDDRGTSVTIDNAGNALITGFFDLGVDFDPGVGVSTYSVSYTSGFVVKISAANTFMWAKVVAHATQNGDYATPKSIRIDATGNIYLAGNYESTIDFDPSVSTYSLTANWSSDMFFSKLNSTGDFIWAKTIGGAPLSDEQVMSMDIDLNNNVYVAGYFKGTNTDFDPNAGTTPLSSLSSGTELFILKLNDMGDFGWVKQSSGTAHEEAHGIACDVYGRVFTTGFYNYDTNFDPPSTTHTLTTVGGSIYVQKIGNGITASVKQHEENLIFSVFPNPTNAVINIEILDNITILKCSIYNLQGQLENAKLEHNSINVSSLSKGIYFLQIETEKGILRNRFIKN